MKLCLLYCQYFIEYIVMGHTIDHEDSHNQSHLISVSFCTNQSITQFLKLKLTFAMESKNFIYQWKVLSSPISIKSSYFLLTINNHDHVSRCPSEGSTWRNLVLCILTELSNEKYFFRFVLLFFHQVIRCNQKILTKRFKLTNLQSIYHISNKFSTPAVVGNETDIISLEVHFNQNGKTFYKIHDNIRDEAACNRIIINTIIK